jgi:glutathione synthase/RimK-type ligase-like ATP-grasp enzyme
MDSLEGYVSDDELAIAPLEELGWEVSTVSWRDRNVRWDDFEIVVLRTTWDYQLYPEEFLGVLTAIERSAAHLENSLDVVKWNLDKRYLQELEAEGIPVVTTIWDAAYKEEAFSDWINRLGTDEIIIKPTISATAEHTYRLREYDDGLEKIFAARPFMVQPFMPAIVSEGEYSLFYFNGEFSHAILKQPKTADFRVQEEHGGLITPIVPGPQVLRAGGKAAGHIAPVPLYARVDLVRDAYDDWLVMELELIEPALYFRMDPESPRRFAEALTKRMNR